MSGWYLHGRCRPSLRRVDITDEQAVGDAFERLRPKLCIHCAAIADIEACESDPAEASKVNVRGTEILAGAADRHSTRLVLISTDYVFDGRAHERYPESAPTNPLQVYGKTKEAAENAVLERARSMVIRLPLLYRTDSDDQGWFRQTLERLATGKHVHADSHQVRQPALIDDVAAAVIALSERAVEGVVHLAPRQVLTRYQWARLMAEAVGAAEDLVIPVDIRGRVPRPLRASLATDRLDRLGIEPPRSAQTVLRDLLGR